jgi:hypothetical protein
VHRIIVTPNYYKKSYSLDTAEIERKDIYLTERAERYEKACKTILVNEPACSQGKLRVSIAEKSAEVIVPKGNAKHTRTP